jgi:hypothetical protein
MDSHPVVDRLGQAEIPELTGTGHIGHRGKQRALHHRAEQHIGRKALRLGGGDCLELRQ